MKKRKRRTRIKTLYRTTAEDVIRTWDNLSDASNNLSDNQGCREHERYLRNAARAYALVVERIEGRS